MNYPTLFSPTVLGGVPVRNRIAHDYGAVDLQIVWAVTQQEIAPLIVAVLTAAAVGAGLGPAPLMSWQALSAALVAIAGLAHVVNSRKAPKS